MELGTESNDKVVECGLGCAIDREEWYRDVRQSGSYESDGSGFNGGGGEEVGGQETTEDDRACEVGIYFRGNGSSGWSALVPGDVRKKGFGVEVQVLLNACVDNYGVDVWDRRQYLGDFLGESIEVLDVELRTILVGWDLLQEATGGDGLNVDVP